MSSGMSGLMPADRPPSDQCTRHRSRPSVALRTLAAPCGWRRRQGWFAAAPCSPRLPPIDGSIDPSMRESGAAPACAVRVLEEVAARAAFISISLLRYFSAYSSAEAGRGACYSTQKVRNRRIIVLATRPDRAFFRSQPTERLAEPSPAFPELE